MTGGASIEDLLDEHVPGVAELARQLLDLIRSAMPDAVERVYVGWHGIGFHHPTAGCVCAVFPGADSVRVGSEHGHLLADPGGGFDSGGNQVRNVTVRNWSSDLAARIAELVDHAVHFQNH